MTYTVSLSHQTWSGARKYQAKTIEEAKRKGDAELTADNLRVKGRGADYRIDVVDDATHRVVATKRVDAVEWHDEIPAGSPYPRMIYPTGNTDFGGVIVNSLDEEEAVLGITHAAEPEPENALMPAKRKRVERVNA